MESVLEIYLPVSEKTYSLLELLEKEQDALPFCLNREHRTLILHGYMKDCAPKVQDDGLDDEGENNVDDIDIDGFDDYDSIF